MKYVSRTVGPFQENCYLVIDDTANHAVLIDPGDEAESLVAMVQESGATLDAIWLTHAHIDHIGGIAGVHRVWRVPVFLHEADRVLYERGAMQAAAYGLPFDVPDPPDEALAEGDVVSVGGLRFDVLHLPGHAPGHVVFRHDHTVFGGDILFARSIGRTDLPFSDPVKMEESLARLCDLHDATDVHPGHGPSTTIGRERLENPFLSGAARIIKR